MAEGIIATRLEINDNLPAQVTAFKAIAANGNSPQITVSWINPTQYFGGILLVKKMGSAPTAINDGEQIYSGAGTSFVDNNVAFGTTYYYRAYPYNPRKQYQTMLAVTSALPKAGTLASELPAGSFIKLKQDGVPTKFLVVNQGLPSYEYDASCNGTWLLIEDIPFYDNWSTSSRRNDYANSTVHEELNTNTINKFTPTIRSQIKSIKLPYWKGTGTSGTAQYGADGLDCKLFLATSKEVGTTQIPADEFCHLGSLLDYFSEGNDTAANSKMIAKYKGKASAWGLRDPHKGESYGGCTIDSDGGKSSMNIANTIGIRFALVLPSDFLLKPTPNSDGSYSPMEE